MNPESSTRILVSVLTPVAKSFSVALEVEVVRLSSAGADVGNYCSIQTDLFFCLFV